MANLNLSEFGEKTFVADADWTFVWDTVGLISKKVSRNNWLNSGTITTDAPVTISQTWNASGQTFKALVVNAAGTSGTNSASGSLLLDLQVGGVSQFSVSKVGAVVSAFSITSSYIQSGANFVLTTDAGALVFGAGADTWLRRDGAANTLALRNGTNAQTFNVYGTWSTAITNFERLAIKYNATDEAYQIAAEKGTTNGDYRPLDFVTGGSRRMTIGTTGNVGIGTTAPSSKLHVAGTIKPEQATMVDKAAGFTLAAVDAGTIINSTSATAITINLPAADTATGYNVMIIQSGAGAVTIAANGNTLNSFGGAVITAGQHAACSIVRTAASTYNLSGNLV